MAELVGAIVEAIAALVAALLEITIHLLAAIFSAGYFATRRRGWERACFIVTLMLLVYLGFGLARASFAPLAGPVTGQFYSPLAVLMAFIALCLSLVIPAAMRRAATPGEARHKPVLLSYALAIALVFGGVAFWGQATRVPEMEERHCTSLLEDLPQSWSDRLQGLATRLPDLPAGISLRIERCMDNGPPAQ